MLHVYLAMNGTVFSSFNKRTTFFTAHNGSCKEDEISSEISQQVTMSSSLQVSFLGGMVFKRSILSIGKWANIKASLCLSVNANRPRNTINDNCASTRTVADTRTYNPLFGPSVRHKVVFDFFSAPAHPSATNAAVYTALFNPNAQCSGSHHHEK